MKKRWKVFWIACISLTVLGSALCISGALLGATVAGIRETFGYWPAVAAGRTYDTPELSAGDGSADTEYMNSGDNVYQTMQFSGIEKLEVEVTRLEVQVTSTEEDQIRVISDVSSDIQNDLIIAQDGNELDIRLKNMKEWDRIHSPAGSQKGILTIEIPNGTRLQETDFNIGAGVLDLMCELKASELDIEVGAGSVYASDFIVDELDLQCGAGEAQLYGEAAEKSKIECGVGSVMFYTAGSQSEYNYDLQCGIGSLIVGDDSISGLGGSRKIDNHADREMKIECGIGEVEVLFDY